MSFKQPYVYTPEELYDFGLLGKARITIWAWLGEEIPGYEIPVSICLIKATFEFKNPSVQEIDVTEAFREDGLMTLLERKTREHILDQRQREWDEETA